MNHGMRTTPSGSLPSAEQPDCGLAPDRDGEYHCEPVDNGDGTGTCSTCGRTLPYANEDAEREIHGY